MARNKRTARKSTGGRAPVQKLATFACRAGPPQIVNGSVSEPDAAFLKDAVQEANRELPRLPTRMLEDVKKESVDSKEEDEPGQPFIPSVHAARTGPILGHAFSDDTTDLATMPVIDLDDEKQAKECMPGFTVCRTPPQIVNGSVTEPDAAFLKDAVKQAKKEFPKSAWVLHWANKKHPNNGGEVSVIAEEELPQLDEKFGVYKAIKPMLESGKLNGCELCGDPDTGQFGLVATRDLAPMTPLAVECGVIWSEDKHSEMLEEHGDPTLGLASIYIPGHMFQRYMTKGKWKRRTKMHGNRVKGFVVESSSHGNESKHIDDPDWLHAGSGTHLPANVETFLLFDLVHEQVTVGFFVKEDVHVKKKVELTMEWHCWKEISFSLLPGKALLSAVKNRERDELHKICEEKGIPVPSPELVEKEVKGTPNLFFEIKDIKQYFPPEVQATLDEKCSVLCSILFTDGEESNEQIESSKAKRAKPTEFKHLLPGEVDYDEPESCIAVRPSGEMTKGLTKEARRSLQRVTMTSVDSKVAPLFKLGGEPLAKRVEVVEIVDIHNPAFLFCLPGDKACAVVAKRELLKDEVILCYGGLLIDDADRINEFDSYLFNCDVSGVDYDGPPLFIAGANSIAGKINDPMAIGGTMNRKANMKAYNHFDGNTKTPQIVFYASRDIEPGEELLYSYGIGYWKHMWKALMMAHVDFTVKASVECRLLSDLIKAQEKGA